MIKLDNKMEKELINVSPAAPSIDVSSTPHLSPGSAKESEVSSMLQIIAQCAKDPAIDIAKMIALKEMRDQELARLKEEAFSVDYVNMKPHLPLVLRPKYNEQTKSWYAAIEDINREIDPILHKYGFATSTPVIAQTDTTVTVAAILRHKSGHTERTQLTLDLDTKGPQGTVNKTTLHGTSSAVKYGMRIALCALLNISTGDDKDGNKLNADGVPIKKKKGFAENVAASAPSSPPTKKEIQWDQKTLYLPGNKKIIEEFKNSEDAGKKLLEELEKFPSKKERLNVMNLNMAIMRALIKKGCGELIDKIHKLADEGK